MANFSSRKSLHELPPLNGGALAQIDQMKLKCLLDFFNFQMYLERACFIVTVFIFECHSVLVDPSFQVHGLTKICLDFTIYLNIYFIELIDDNVRAACPRHWAIDLISRFTVVSWFHFIWWVYVVSFCYVHLCKT